MASKSNWDYLVNAVKKNDEMFIVLSNWFFGETPSIEVCAEKAYKDLQRNLRGIGKTNIYDEKQAYKKDIIELIKANITELFDMNLNNQKEQKRRQECFDNWHKNVCNQILKRSQNIEEHLEDAFSYGLAQKWLNMTIKNMLVAETADWTQKLKRIRNLLHVPVDNYVLDAAYKVLGIRDSKEGKYALKNPWSKWEYDVYIIFQEKIRNAICHREDYKCPIDWEFDAWINEKVN